MVGFMKTKRYEKIYLLIFVIILLFILEILFFSYLFIYKRYNYIKYNGVVRTDGYVMVMVKDIDVNYFYKSNYLFNNSKKKKFEIIELNKNVYKKNNNFYHLLLINVNTSKDLIDNDLYEFSLKTEKLKSINIFKMIWED